MRVKTKGGPLGVRLAPYVQDWVELRAKLNGRSRSDEVNELLENLSNKDVLAKVTIEQDGRTGHWMIRSFHTRERFKSFPTREHAIRHARQSGIKAENIIIPAEEAA
jgi:hypothetical protein